MNSGSRETQSTLDQAASVFVGLRPRLFGVAYRMLGCSLEAEDIVQEVWLRWQTTDRTAVMDPPGFLITATTRMAINVLRSARRRRETYLGPGVPEPVDTGADPQIGAERGEALELGVLLLLAKLSPTERAAYVLREAFDYGYPGIATVLELSEVNARQLVSRARRHLAFRRCDPVGRSEHRHLLEAFLTAAQTGNLPVLEELLASGARSCPVGGGAVRTARNPLAGRTRAATFPMALARRCRPGAVLVSHGATRVALLSITPSARGIDELLWVLNPAELAGIPVAP
ncbi:sigma-70 family RNA polymerase sigma factor [Pseudonocardia xinjiangensis]|uniref:sigma-70 family RNA polymerase sigma factor n=1 Tax=Pseudonocardia xinjiangensis TaxID=75289 RepID=UPI003D8F9E93